MIKIEMTRLLPSFIVMYFYLFSIAIGQITWIKTYGSTEIEYSRGIIETNDLGLAFVGMSNGGHTGGSFYLVRTDADGNEIYSKTFVNGMAMGLCQAPKGKIVLVGDHYTGVGYLGRVVCVDSNGNTKWSKSIPGLLSATAVIPTFDGGFAVSGKAFSGSNDLFGLIKLDSNGNDTWSKNFRGTASYDILQLPDSDYVLVGTLKGDSAVIIRTDKNGDSIWTKKYDYNDFRAVKSSPDGAFLVAGNSPSKSGDAVVLKIDLNGNLIWEKKFGGPGLDIIYDLDVNSEGDICICGTTAGSFTFSYDMYFMELDSGGDSIYMHYFGGPLQDRNFGCVYTKDSGIVTVGEYYHTSKPDFDAIMIKYGGSIINSYSNEIHNIKPPVFPAVNENLIIFDNLKNRIQSAALYSIEGKHLGVFRNLSGNTLDCDISGLKSGIYLIAAEFDGIMNFFKVFIAAPE